MIFIKTKKKIQSDYRERGIDDGSPIIFPGTKGCLIGRPKGVNYKGNLDDCWEIKFPKGSFVLSRDEFMLLND